MESRITHLYLENYHRRSSTHMRVLPWRQMIPPRRSISETTAMEKWPSLPVRCSSKTFSLVQSYNVTSAYTVNTRRTLFHIPSSLTSSCHSFFKEFSWTSHYILFSSLHSRIFYHLEYFSTSKHSLSFQICSLAPNVISYTLISRFCMPWTTSCFGYHRHMLHSK